MLRALLATVLCAAALAVAQDGGEGQGGYDAPYFQADFTQDLNSWTSALVNPALLYRVNQMHASMAFYRWGMDRGNMGYQDFSIFYPLRLRHTAGLTILHARNTMDRVRVAQDNDGEMVSEGSVSYQDLWIVGNYGVRVLPWLMLGGNLKLRSQTQFGRNAFSKVPGLDVGVYINPIDHYHWGDFGISLTAQDILPTQTPWAFNFEDGVRFPGTSDLITVSRGRIGLRYAGLNNNLVVSTEMIVDNAFRDIFAALNWEDFKRMVVSVGDGDLPSASELAGMFPIAFRWGLHAKYQFIPQIWFKGGWTNNNIPYLGFSYNLLYPLPEMINYFTFDYNFGYSFLENASNMNDERGLVMMLRASTDFGRTREQKESRRMYGKLVVAPMDAYQEAMRLYTAGRYWEASFAFGRLIALYPNFYLNDRAVYFMGDCYKKLFMNNTAREVFRAALDEYTTSDMRAHYLYGLMALDYREENYDEAMRNHSFIINLYAESDIVGEAEYLAGEIAFIAGNMEAARAHLERVSQSDPSHLYALYTLSIVNYETEREQAAIANLRAIIDDTTSRAADHKLQHAAAVKLGHIHFEGQRLREAGEAYAMVPNSARPYGDEALLGLAWALIKAGQPPQTLQMADRIIAQHPQSPFVPEAHLLRGYALMLQHRHDVAITAFETALATADGAFVTDADVATRRVQFDRVSDEFAPVADRIRRNAMRRPTPRTVEERPELQRGYETFARENQEFFEYRMLAKSHRNFFMRREDIVADANFALARATRLMHRRGGPQAPAPDTRIDDDLERLRQQLEAME
jgi:tetratricopeptide (TPR) repeat protein